MGQNLDDVLHVGTTEVHGTTVDVVKNQFHVVTLRRGGTNFHFERELHDVTVTYLDEGKENGDDIVTPPLKVDQKRAEERRNRTQDKTMCPQVGVLGKKIYQLSEEGPKFIFLYFFGMTFWCKSTLQTTLTSQNFPVTNASEKSWSTDVKCASFLIILEKFFILGGNASPEASF